jgi:hypothetical protein
LDASNEVKDCTFEPKLNNRASPLRNSSKKYVENYLYTPRARIDIDKSVIEYEK